MHLRADVRARVLVDEGQPVQRGHGVPGDRGMLKILMNSSIGAITRFETISKPPERCAAGCGSDGGSGPAEEYPEAPAFRELHGPGEVDYLARALSEEEVVPKPRTQTISNRNSIRISSNF